MIFCSYQKAEVKFVILEISECAIFIPECCDIATVDMKEFASEEKRLLEDYMPTAKTAIVLAHHVTAALEWVWFPFETERLNNTCAADLHAKTIVGKIVGWLYDKDFSAVTLPYPGRCGVAFKDIAAKTNLGELGASYLFLHKKWGPWTHLRILLTDATFVNENAENIKVCDYCAACIKACPAGVIKEGSFDGSGCGEYQKVQLQEKGIAGSYLWKCEICARVCSKGIKPNQVKIKA